jgi:hypothetical protein
MQQYCPYGSVRGATGNRRSYRDESLDAFDGRCIPARGVAPPSNTPGILRRRALRSGRLARLGATPDFHHGLLTAEIAEKGSLCDLCVLRGQVFVVW